jgi:hypothetical protein
MRCPACRGRNVEPLPAPGGAVDYIVAERGQGTASADVMFAEWVKWCGYVTTNQYDAAMHRQNSDLQPGVEAKPIHEVMVGLGFFSEEQAIGLLRFLSMQRPDADDEDFAARLLAQGDVDEGAVEQAAKAQREMSNELNEVPPLGQLLVQGRAITEARLLDLLREQARDGKGSLRTALSMSEPSPKETVVGKLAERVPWSGRALLKIAAVALLALVGIVLVASQLRRPQEEAYGFCTACESYVAVGGRVSGWPTRCPACRQWAVRFAVKCPKGHVFTRRSPRSQEPCPECGAGFARPLTAEEFAELAH